MAVCKYSSVQVWQCANMAVCKYGSVQVWQCASMAVCKYGSVQIWHCASTVWQCASMAVSCVEGSNLAPGGGHDGHGRGCPTIRPLCPQIL